MSKKCDIIEDLLPLYIDGACSKASEDMIKDHIGTCEHCRKIYEKMSSHASEDALLEEKSGVIVRHERKETLNTLKCLFLAAAIIYFPAIFILALFADDSGSIIAIPYGMKLLSLFLYTFPCYVALIELGLAVLRALDKCKRSIGEKIFGAVSTLLALATIIASLSIDDSLDIPLLLTVLLSLTLLIKAIVYKKELHLLSIMKQKTFWICTAILTVVVAVVVSIPIIFLSANGIEENTVEFHYSAGVRESGSEYEGLYFDIGIEEQHDWDFFGKKPYITAKLVNETGHDIEYSPEFYIYKKTNDGWGLSCVNPVDFPDVIYTLPFGESVVKQYPLDGYDINEARLYKFVTFIEGKAVWFEFEITEIIWEANVGNNCERYDYTFIVTDLNDSEIILSAIGADGKAIGTDLLKVPNWFYPSTSIVAGDKITVICSSAMEITEDSPAKIANITAMTLKKDDGCSVSVIPG